MKSLPLVLLIAASHLLLSVTAQYYDRPQCCQSRGCKACPCRSASYKYTAEDIEALRKFLEENSVDSNKQSETSEGAPDYVIENRARSDNSKYNLIKDDGEDIISEEDDGDDIIRRPSNKTDSQLPNESTNSFAALNPMNCLLCKISHC